MEGLSIAVISLYRKQQRPYQFSQRLEEPYLTDLPMVSQTDNYDYQPPDILQYCVSIKEELRADRDITSDDEPIPSTTNYTGLTSLGSLPLLVTS